ncbi:hypothetical protein ACFFGT_23170 [Mucilaginibacter angelicae]|uniref:DUF4397 domain-containing protein n=1 Tax=Mucilaginibacter angelicae TaxID=869718 RepID=A0ABV6LCD1_9SPHI
MKPSTILSAIQLLLNNAAPALRIRNNYVIQFALVMRTRRSVLNVFAIACCLLLANCTKEKVEPNTAPSPAPMGATAVNATMAATTGSPLDNLSIIEMPIANGYLYGNINGTGLYNFKPTAREVLHPEVASRVIINTQLTQAGFSINFVKGGYLPSSGKPFYFLKVADKYLSVGLIGLYFADAIPQNEQLSKWVFTKGPQVTGAPGTTFFISSVGFGATTVYSLQVLHDDSRNEYYIGFRPLNSADKQQVFSISNTSSVPPNTK